MKKASPHFLRELTTKNTNRFLEPVKQAEVTVKFRKIVMWQVQIRYNLQCLKFSVTVSKEFLTAPSKQVTRFLIKIVWALACSNRLTLSCIRATMIPVSATSIAWVLVTPLQLIRASVGNQEASQKVAKATVTNKASIQVREFLTQGQEALARPTRTMIIK
jgi:hypothetical protein